MKRWLTIQEHHAKRAGLHWDLRIENDVKKLASWVIPKHRLPVENETLLAIPVEDHSWDYRNFDGEIADGYGAGIVKLIHSDEVEVQITDKKIKFEYEEKNYTLFKIDEKKWLITLKTKAATLKKADLEALGKALKKGIRT